MAICSGISHSKWWCSIAMLNYQMVSEASHYQRVSPTTSPSCAKLGGGIGGSLGINGAGLGASKRAGKFKEHPSKWPWTSWTIHDFRHFPAVFWSKPIQWWVKIGENPWLLHVSHWNLSCRQVRGTHRPDGGEILLRAAGLAKITT